MTKIAMVTALLLAGCAPVAPPEGSGRDALAAELAGRVAGEPDRCIPTRGQEPLRIIDAAGHLPHVEQPHDFVEALTGLIGGRTFGLGALLGGWLTHAFGGPNALQPVKIQPNGRIFDPEAVMNPFYVGEFARVLGDPRARVDRFPFRTTCGRPSRRSPAAE